MKRRREKKRKQLNLVDFQKIKLDREKLFANSIESNTKQNVENKNYLLNQKMTLINIL